MGSKVLVKYGKDPKEHDYLMDINLIIKKVVGWLFELVSYGDGK